jgi:hypothetical protein
MSADRLERRLPEVLTELSLPVMPDYIDNLLSRTERMSQRPRWSLLERWIPVSTFEATLAGRRPVPLRPLIVLAIVAALLAASLVWYVGSQKHLPPLIGLARNGFVVTNDSKGDIVKVDPATGDIDTLVTGGDLCCAAMSPNGQYIDYLRVLTDGADPAALFFANADGSTIRELPSNLLPGLQHSEWSPASDTYLVTSATGTFTFDIASGAVTRVTAPFAVTRASWIGTTGDLLLSSLVNGGASGNTVRVFRLSAGSTDPTPVATLEWAVSEPEVSPDGSKFLYFIWADETRLHGRVHVYDLTSNQDMPVTSEDAGEPDHNVLDPHWSPDGTLILSEWLFAGYDQLGLSPATGGDPIFIGPKSPENGIGEGSGFRFSPDGKSVLAHYGFDGSTWLLPVNGDPGRQVSWSVTDEWGWQRLAP